MDKKERKTPLEVTGECPGTSLETWGGGGGERSFSEKEVKKKGERISIILFRVL